MIIFNSLTRQKEELVPGEDGKVGIYVCGPTVYGYIHVGNARPFVFFQVLARYLRDQGYDVTVVENITDVDDKIIDRAREEGRAPEKVSRFYSEAYIQDTGRLGLGRPDIEPRATEHIGEIIALCQKLIELDMAYETGGSVYYRVQRFPGYGKLSGQKTDQMKHLEPPREGEAKENPLDFAVWKAAKRGEPVWDSPWGPGRPGWHIECTAMSLKYLGESFDIHGGGRDLIFPHHENEVAQAEAVTGGEFVRYWMHNGMITRKEEKMSKSVGNIFLLREFLKHYDPRVLILFFAATHYRNPLEFSTTNLEEAQAQLDRLRNCYWKMHSVIEETEIVPDGEGAPSGEYLKDAIVRADKEFHAEMQDDANTAGALAALFGLVKAINEYTEEASVAGKADAELLGEARDLLTRFLRIIGIELTMADFVETGLEAELLELVEAREKARDERDYAEADAARDRIREAGYEIRDTPQGPRLVKRK
ncbi:MAG: cysteine--tRNA ligase [Thermoleophilia bacterium]|nr:cysteine--tRNA ligase [Thermoleophilia bacterium]